MKTREICFEITLISILTTGLVSNGIGYSLQAIFFPKEAESKGANAFEYGLIFAIYGLVTFIFSPIIGSHIHLFHIKTTILFGMILCGSTTILFGLTDKLETTWAFLVWCCVLRMCEGFGGAFILMASIILVTTEFPQSIAFYVGVLDTGFQIGSGIGPSIGAPLFELGGFELPFFCAGGFLVVFTLIPLFLISNEDKSSATEEPGQGFGFFGLLQTPPVLLYAFNALMVGVGRTFVISMLEPHIRRFEMTDSEIGLMFLAMNVVYALTTPIFGCWADRMVYPGFLTLLGLLFFAIAFLLIGPATFIPLKPTIAWTTVGLVLVGLGQVAISVPGFPAMIQESERAGFTDEFSRTGLVSGLSISAFCLGAFIGPTLGGLIVTHFGFPFAADFLFIAFSMQAIIMGLFLRHRVTQHVPLK